jgi:Uma2 family endonuclease
MATTVELLTAEEYSKLPDAGQPSELVRGKIVEINVPTPKHGRICCCVGLSLGEFVESRDIGHVMVNDSGVITTRNPDTVRGADVSYYSYARLPKGPVPEGYLQVAPELVVEVLSPTDRWSELHVKTAEYLKAGVLIVCALDPNTPSAHLYYPNRPPRILASEDDLEFPEVLGEFRVPVGRLYE